MKCLDDTSLNKVQVIPSRKLFKFGDGWKFYSKHQAITPAKIGKTKCYIQTKIVNEKILLLLSKSSLQKADTYINIKEYMSGYMCVCQQMDTMLLRFYQKKYVILIPLNIVWYLRLMMTSIKNVQN